MKQDKAEKVGDIVHRLRHMAEQFTQIYDCLALSFIFYKSNYAYIFHSHMSA